VKKTHIREKKRKKKTRGKRDKIGEKKRILKKRRQRVGLKRRGR
jgi:hypothetical protein